MTGGRSNEPDEALRAFVERSGLFADPAQARFAPMTGGVSSDIWLVEDGRRAVCVKRALARLRVAAAWYAPVERNVYEAAWLKDANRLVPGSAPEVLSEDAALGMFAMDYLDPSTHQLWKADLLAGKVNAAVAEAVGRRLGALHAAFAREPDASTRFATDANFFALRLEPYLLATAEAHPDLGKPLTRLAADTAATKRTVVHGDVSPKNIVVGPSGPILLDAECAWFGDPAFDLAFCLNHLLLKCLAVRDESEAFLDAFHALASAYLSQVDWEARAEVETRAARLLPGLFLARVDGKSPVEYVTDEENKMHVRRTARRLLDKQPVELADVSRAWAHEIGEAA